MLNVDTEARVATINHRLPRRPVIGQLTNHPHRRIVNQAITSHQVPIIIIIATRRRHRHVINRVHVGQVARMIRLRTSIRRLILTRT